MSSICFYTPSNLTPALKHMAGLKSESGYCFGFSYTAADLFLNHSLESIFAITEEIQAIPLNDLENTINNVIHKRNELVVKEYPNIEEKIKANDSSIKRLALQSTIAHFNQDIDDIQMLNDEQKKFYNEEYSIIFNRLLSTEQYKLENEKLSSKEKNILQIKPLLYTIRILHELGSLPDLLGANKKPYQLQNAEKSYLLAESVRLNSNDFEENQLTPSVCFLDKFSGYYSITEIKILFDLLNETFKKIVPDGRIAFVLQNENHAITLGYDVVSNDFYFININPTKPQDLAGAIYESFSTKRSHAVFSTTVLVNNDKNVSYLQNAFLTLREDLKWKSIHQFDSSKIDAEHLTASLLLCASVIGDVKTIDSILKVNMINPTLKNNITGSTALYAAVERNQHSAVKILLGHDQINPNDGVSHSLSPLYKAAVNGNVMIVKALLNHAKIDPNLCTEDMESPLLGAAFFGNDEVVDLLLNDSRINPIIAKNDGGSALLFAAQEGHENIVNMILKDGRIDPNKQRNDGCTALYMACKNKNINVIKLLLSNVKIDPNLGGGIDESTPILVAASVRAWEIVELLLEDRRINPFLPNHNGVTLLHLSSEIGQLIIVEKLLSDNRCDPNVKLSGGETPLHLAVFNKNLEMVKLLLEHPNVNPNLQIDNGASPLFLAAQFGQIEIVKILLKKGANPTLKFLSTVDSLRKFSVLKGIEIKMAAFIQQKLMASPSSTSIEVTPLEIANLMGHNDIVVLLREKVTNNLQLAKQFTLFSELTAKPHSNVEKYIPHNGR